MQTHVWKGVKDQENFIWFYLGQGLCEHARPFTITIRFIFA